MRSLAQDAKDRYQTAKEFGDALRGFVARRKSQAKPVS